MSRWQQVLFFSIIILANTHSWSEGLKGSLSKKQENLTCRKKKLKDSFSKKREGVIYRFPDGSYEKKIPFTKEELELLIPSFPDPTKYKGLKGTLRDGTVFYITRKPSGEGTLIQKYTNKQFKKQSPKIYKKMEWQEWKDKMLYRFGMTTASIGIVVLAIFGPYELYTRFQKKE